MLISALSDGHNPPRNFEVAYVLPEGHLETHEQQVHSETFGQVVRNGFCSSVEVLHDTCVSWIKQSLNP